MAKFYDGGFEHFPWVLIEIRPLKRIDFLITHIFHYYDPQLSSNPIILLSLALININSLQGNVNSFSFDAPPIITKFK
jgi:hypothetical protein